MSKLKIFRHEWTISGLSSVCDRITAHPYIESIIDYQLKFHFYPVAYDESCREYVSLNVFKIGHLVNLFIQCEISIENDKNEKLFVKEIKMKENAEYLKEFFRRDDLLDPANDLTNNDRFTLCFEVWLHNREVIIRTNHENTEELSSDYFDFSPLLSTKSLAFKWTIENVKDLFKMSNKSSIKLPEYNDSTASDEAIFRPRIQIIKDLNKQVLFFKLKSDYQGLIVIETYVIDINQHKCHSQKRALESFVHNFLIDKNIFSSPSILSKNRLALFCEISRITESIQKDDTNAYNYLRILKCFEIPTDLQITEWTIDGRSVKTIQNQVLSSSSIEDNEIEIEKLDEWSNVIAAQTSTIDNATFIVNKVYHEHYFENANVENSLVNTKSKSIFGNISFKSETTDCTELIEKLEAVACTIRPVLDQQEQMYAKIKSSTADLFAEVLDKNKVLLENQQEMDKDLKEILSELNKMKQTKKVKKSKIKQVFDKIIALLNRIKYELNKVGTNVSTKIKQVRVTKSSLPKPREPTLAKSNFVINHIESHTSFLIKYVQSVPTSQSINNKTKQSHIHRLETVKTFLITNLPAEICSVNNQLVVNLQNEHFEIDSITKENAEHKLAEIINNHSSDWDKKLLSKLRDLIAECKL